MAPLIKYFIIVFTVFYLFSYNGCLADRLKVCKDEINDLFSDCSACNSLNEEARVKGYLDHILLYIRLEVIEVTPFALSFVNNIIPLRKTTVANKPDSPKQFCIGIYKYSDCDQGMRKLYGSNYDDQQKSIKKTFEDVSKSYIYTYYSNYQDSMIAYMEHVQSYTGVDTSKFGSIGTNAERHCFNAVRGSAESQMSWNNPAQFGGGWSSFSWSRFGRGQAGPSFPERNYENPMTICPSLGRKFNPNDESFSRDSRGGRKKQKKSKSQPVAYYGRAPNTTEGYDDWCPPQF